MRDYKIETVASGTCTDRVGGDLYNIETYIFRGNQDVIDGYMDSRIRSDNWEFDDQQGYLDYVDKQDKARAEWEKDIKDLLGWHKDTGSITHNVSEFFTAVFIEKEEK